MIEAGRIDRKTLIGYTKERPQLPRGVGPVDILAKTRDKDPLTTPEMFGFINGITDKTVTDYQASAWLMAVRMNGLTQQETVDLTLSMTASGEVLDLDYLGVVADKHSSGGVGDKTTLVVAPLVAACDIKVGKMTGKGLGHTGGTVDKLESIPGFTTSLSVPQFTRQVEDIGIVLAGQTSDLAPADGKLYAIRDVTATVDSIPLIASSIMSKKIAAGPNTLVLDVKTGTGAFMKTVDEARDLARVMVDIGKSVGLSCVAEISDMNQPLGSAVGNALEVRESIDTLKGGGPKDFVEHCVDTAARIVLLAKKTDTMEQAVEMVKGKLADGTALEKFREMVEAQGGNPMVVDAPDLILPQAAYKDIVVADRDGFVAGVDPMAVGLTAMRLGGGRQRKEDVIDPAVGVEVFGKIGQRVERGQTLFVVHANEESRIESARHSLGSSVSFSEASVEPLPLVYDVIE